MSPTIRRVTAASILGPVLAILWAQLVAGGLIDGRVDPAFGIGGRIIAVAVLAFASRRWLQGHVHAAALAMIALTAASDIAIGLWLGDRVAWLQIFIATAAQLLAWPIFLVVARKLSGWGGPMAIALIASGLVGLSVWVMPHGYQPRTGEPASRLGLVAGVPVEWDGAPDIEAILAGDAVSSPLLPALKDRYRVSRIDHLTMASLAEIDVLLLAHPYAMAPAELVAIDEWVRAGGKAVILADGLSSWPAPYPFGDPRNPPVTSLLTALLDHWGLALDAPSDPREEVFIVAGLRVRAASVGAFSARGDSCTVDRDRRSARCVFPAHDGEAILIADADFLYPPLWTAGGANPARWRNGNVAWLTRSIDSLTGIDTGGLFEPVWRKASPSDELTEGDRGDGPTS